MRVKSACKGLYNIDSDRDRKALGFLVLLGIFFIGSSFTKPSDGGLRAKQVNVIIRQIGHRLLLQAGDSTSRVMPVTETQGGTFLLQFENEFVFSHDSLMSLSRDLLPKTQFPSGYIVTVHDCRTADIVFGFQFNNTSPDLMPCRGRREPTGCYTVEFTFPDFDEKAEPVQADIDHLAEEPKSVIANQEAKPKLKEIKTTTPGNDIDQLTEETKSVTVEQEVRPKLEESNTTTSEVGIDQLTKEARSVTSEQEAKSKSEELKPTIFGDPLTNLVYGGILVLGIALVIGHIRKIQTPVAVQNLSLPLQNQNEPITEASTQELAALGKFSFDGKGQRLLLGNEVISLTDKECKILELFNNSFGELIPRETLMQKVWIDEGVITGRSLDMFVSKLRKKLSSDPELRITNVHGKGYKLEIL